MKVYWRSLTDKNLQLLVLLPRIIKIHTHTHANTPPHALPAESYFTRFKWTSEMASLSDTSVSDLWWLTDPASVNITYPLLSPLPLLPLRCLQVIPVCSICIPNRRGEDRRWMGGSTCCVRWKLIKWSKEIACKAGGRLENVWLESGVEWDEQRIYSWYGVFETPPPSPPLPQHTGALTHL